MLAQILDDVIFHYHNQAHELDYTIRPGEGKVCIKNLVTNECLILDETELVEIRKPNKNKMIWPKKEMIRNDH